MYRIIFSNGEGLAARGIESFREYISFVDVAGNNVIIPWTSIKMIVKMKDTSVEDKKVEEVKEEVKEADPSDE